jgi:hypothetical protein
MELIRESKEDDSFVLQTKSIRRRNLRPRRSKRPVELVTYRSDKQTHQDVDAGQMPGSLAHSQAPRLRSLGFRSVPLGSPSEERAVISKRNQKKPISNETRWEDLS